jgi:hypothetical protein
MEYDVKVGCGDYFLEVVYATPDTEPPRSLRFSIDGRVADPALLNRRTPGFAAYTRTAALVGLTSGDHLLRFERNSPFPHIVSMRLIPASTILQVPGLYSQKMLDE